MSNNGIVKKYDDSFSYEIVIDNEANILDHEIWYEVLPQVKGVSGLNKVNVLNLKERSQEKLNVIAAAINRQQPEFLLFGDGSPIRGKMKDMVFEDNILKINFFKPSNDERLQIEKQMSALLLFDIAPAEITSLKESMQTESVLGNIDKIQKITYDNKKDKMISFHSARSYDVK